MLLQGFEKQRALAPAENLGARVTEEVRNQDNVIAHDTKTGCSPSLQVSVTETDKRKAGREASYELHAGEMTAQAGESQRQHSIGKIQGAHNPLVVNSLDVRLTVAGAVCDQTGRLLTGAYKCLISRFAHQPQEKQPDPLRPGLLHHECTEAVSLVGLRWWSSPGTCGWIAQASNTEVERRFSVQMWNSWRLAFLLARLQRDVWESKLSNHAANSCSSTEHTSELRQHSPRERQEVSQCHAADRAPVCGLRGVRHLRHVARRHSIEQESVVH